MTEPSETVPKPPDVIPPPPGVRNVYIGFNYTIDRQSISKLLNVVGVILERKPRPKNLIFCISSDGGSPEQAGYAYEILHGLPVGIVTINVGFVASAAVTLFLAGNVRLAAPKTTFLFHETKFTTGAPGVMRENELEFTVKNLRHHQDKLTALIAERTKKPLAEIKKWAIGEKLRTEQFALEHGIISAIEGPVVGDQDEFIQVIL